MRLNIHFSIFVLVMLIPAFCKSQSTQFTEQNVQLALQSFDAFNKHNWELQAAFFSDTCKVLDPSYGDKHVIVNRKDKAIKYQNMELTSPDIKDSITCIFGFGDKVVIQFTSTGTAKMETEEYKWSVPICCIFTYKDGLVIIDEVYYNRGK